MQFALLTDWRDAPTEHLPDDDALLDAAVQAIERLNALYPVGADEPPRFIVLHRGADLCRIRAALDRLGAQARQARAAARHAGRGLGLALRRPRPGLDRRPGVRYVLTLDSDTRLPPGRLRDLVGVAAHPHNRPRLAGRRPPRGARLRHPAAARRDAAAARPRTSRLYHWLFAGQSGIDPYSVASSEVYQDLFGEGTFTGKGLLDVQAVHAVLGGRLPPSQVLSHDLLEGSLARCAAVTDVSVIEDAPFHADVAASRVHRWTRGDWQLLPILLRPGRYPIRAINRWKMVDNLRRSLVAPASLAARRRARWRPTCVSPWVALALVALAFTAGPLMGTIAGIRPSRDDVARAHFYRQWLADLARVLLSGAWLLAQMMQLALMAIDAIVRAVWRTAVSRRRLLEWTTAAAAQASATTDLATLVRKHWGVVLAAVGLWAGLMAIRRAASAARHRALRRLGVVAGLDLVGQPAAAAAPRRCLVAGGPRLPPRRRPRHLAPVRALRRAPGPPPAARQPADSRRTTWSRTAPRRPTSACTCWRRCAPANTAGSGAGTRSSGWRRPWPACRALPRHRGHFLNWYDTERAQALLPQYVSTVDSGNLCMHLLAVARACLELEAGRGDDSALRRELARSKARIDALRRSASERPLPAGATLAALLDEADPLASLAADIPGATRAARRRARRAARRAARGRERRRREPAVAPGLGDRGLARDLALGPARPRWRRRRDGPPRRRRRDLPAAGARARLRLPLQPQAPPLPHRLSRRRAPARRRLLRPARLRGARHQPVGDRQGRRARRPLGRARPAAVRLSATSPACAPGRARCSST